jgi:hypothetical protein
MMAVFFWLQATGFWPFGLGLQASGFWFQAISKTQSAAVNNLRQ